MSPVFIDRKCTDCDGSGLVFRKNAKWGNACPRCNGMGSIGECREATPEEMKTCKPTDVSICPICNGTGEFDIELDGGRITCTVCYGLGKLIEDAEALRLETVRGAAEDMLAALKLFIAAGLGNSTDFQKQSVASKAAISAIAKAEGRK